MKLGISSAKIITYQLKWFVLIMKVKWRLLVDMLICFKYIRHIELDHCKIYYINNCQINNKSHDFHLHKLSILKE